MSTAAVNGKGKRRRLSPSERPDTFAKANGRPNQPINQPSVTPHALAVPHTAHRWRVPYRPLGRIVTGDLQRPLATTRDRPPNGRDQRPSTSIAPPAAWRSEGVARRPVRVLYPGLMDVAFARIWDVLPGTMRSAPNCAHHRQRNGDEILGLDT
jgi:hypothetical protein